VYPSLLDPERRAQMEDTIQTTEELARRLAERVRQDHGEGAKIERLVLVASVTEEDGTQRAVVEAAETMPLYERAGTLRHALTKITAAPE
jgi:hypothetical protein